MRLNGDEVDPLTLGDNQFEHARTRNSDGARVRLIGSAIGTNRTRLDEVNVRRGSYSSPEDPVEIGWRSTGRGASKLSSAGVEPLPTVARRSS